MLMGMYILSGKEGGVSSHRVGKRCLWCGLLFEAFYSKGHVTKTDMEPEQRAQLHLSASHDLQMLRASSLQKKPVSMSSKLPAMSVTVPSAQRSRPQPSVEGSKCGELLAQLEWVDWRQGSPDPVSHTEWLHFPGSEQGT